MSALATALAAHGSRTPAPVARRTRIARRDLPWLPWTTVATVGPLQPVGRDDVVAAVARVVVAEPALGLDRTPDVGGRHWLTGLTDAASFAERVVVALPADPAADYDDWASDLAARTDLPWPFAVVVAHDHVAVVASHGLGDGRWVNAVLPLVVREALGDVPDGRRADAGDVVVRPPAGAVTRAPYLRAVVRYAAADPRRAVRTLTRSLVSGSGWAGLLCRSGYQRTDTGGRYVAFRPEPRAVYRAMPAATFTAVRAWRKEHAPGTSTPALELALVLRAFAAAGQPVAPAVHVPYDVRRYLAPDAVVGGNLVVGLDLALDATTPVDGVCAALAAAAHAGRPLTALALRLARPPRAVRSAQSGVRPVPPGLRAGVPLPADAPAELAFTHIGRPRAVEQLPWAGGRDRAYMGSVAPGSPAGVTVAAVETGGRLGLSASFHGSVVPVERVTAALDLLCTDPLSLLQPDLSTRRSS